MFKEINVFVYYFIICLFLCFYNLSFSFIVFAEIVYLFIFRWFNLNFMFFIVLYSYSIL